LLTLLMGAEGDEGLDADFVGGEVAEGLESGRRGRPVVSGGGIVDVGGLGQRGQIPLGRAQVVVGLDYGGVAQALSRC